MPVEVGGAWLTSGDIKRSILSEIAAVLLKFDAYCLRNKMGETMHTQIKHSAKYPVSRFASAMQDIRMVSAFAVWALVLGASPVLVFQALT
jgi:hypothetical protein